MVRTASSLVADCLMVRVPSLCPTATYPLTGLTATALAHCESGSSVRDQAAPLGAFLDSEEIVPEASHFLVLMFQALILLSSPEVTTWSGPASPRPQTSPSECPSMIVYLAPEAASPKMIEPFLSPMSALVPTTSIALMRIPSYESVFLTVRVAVSVTTMFPSLPPE